MRVRWQEEPVCCVCGGGWGEVEHHDGPDHDPLCEHCLALVKKYEREAVYEALTRLCERRGIA